MRRRYMNYFYEDFTEKNYMRLLEIMSREGGAESFVPLIDLRKTVSEFC